MNIMLLYIAAFTLVVWVHYLNHLISKLMSLTQLFPWVSTSPRPDSTSSLRPPGFLLCCSVTTALPGGTSTVHFSKSALRPPGFLLCCSVTTALPGGTSTVLFSKSALSPKMASTPLPSRRTKKSSWGAVVEVSTAYLSVPPFSERRTRERSAETAAPSSIMPSIMPSDDATARPESASTSHLASPLLTISMSSSSRISPPPPLKGSNRMSSRYSPDDRPSTGGRLLASSPRGLWT